MKFYVYILINNLGNKTYVGYTNNLVNRLTEHNNGESFYTKRFGPWKILFTEEFEGKNEAVKREKYFKSASGRKWIKKTLFEN